MLKHTTLTETRIKNALLAIESQIYPERLAVEVEAWHVAGEPVPYATAVQAQYQPFHVGDAWGPSWDTTWFKIRGEVPLTWSDRKVVILFQATDSGREGFTAEGLIYSKGRPIRAVNRARNEIDLSQYRSGETFELYVEAAANLSQDYGAPAIYGPSPLFVLAQAELAYQDPAAFQFYYDYKTATEAMLALPEGQRRAELRYALNESLNQWDPSIPSSLNSARHSLENVLSRKNGDTVHRLTAVGNAHIDTAWLWPLRETIRKCARTFSTALDYMDRYPEYVFACSQPQQYAWMKAYYPTIYEGIKKQIKRGQWEVVGSMWVEVDCNLASGESLIRQILYGKQFFEEEFGYETRDAWLPDVFGYSAALPQIFKGCGIDYFVTQKISWNQVNKFPHHSFLWEGIDGTRIFTHFPPAETYVGKMIPSELLFNVSNFLEHGRATRSLYLYGHGDGGGGPSIDMLEQARRLQNFEGLPKVIQGKAIDFLKQAAEDARDPAIWVGELYLELHRGTYTSQAKTKRDNRKNEFLLRDAEFFDALSTILNPNRKENAANPERAVYDVTGLEAKDPAAHRTALERAWKLLLLNQFHDIIPGSSIDWVYRDAARDYEAVSILGTSVLESSLREIDRLVDTTRFQAPVRVANSLNWERREVVEFPDGSIYMVTAPSLGYVIIDGQAYPDNAREVIVEQKTEGILLQNRFLRILLGQDGTILSLWDLEENREIIPTGKVGNLLQIHQDRPNASSAWDIDLFYKESCRDITDTSRLEISEVHPLRAKVKIERSFGKSHLRQEVTLTASSRRIDFETEVDWKEDEKLLKVAFPIDVLSPKATYEIQFGHTERPTHYNTSWDQARFEVCAHKWADLSEPGYGVALLNDCKYGYDIHGSTMRLSLLRSPTAPDPTADRGVHSFTYSLLPHRGDFREGQVIKEAYQLNVPLKMNAMERHPGSLPERFSAFEVDRSGIIIEAIKTAENQDGIIVRLYEAHGSRGHLQLRTTLPILGAELTDMLENKQAGLEVRDGEVGLFIRPFEIVTIRLKL